MRCLHWFRNDLRLRDNTALRAAAAGGTERLILLYVLDPRLLASQHAGLPRTHFLLDGLERLASELDDKGQKLVVRRGRAEEVVPRLAEEARADRVTWNADTTPFAVRRDGVVRRELERLGMRVETPVDRVVFTGDDLRTGQGDPYVVYTPFKKAWRRRFAEDPAPARRAPSLPPPLASIAAGERPGPGDEADEGAGRSGEPGLPGELPTAGEAAAHRRLHRFLEDRVARYAEGRDRPAVDGTSRLSAYLRFGMLSPRQCVEAAHRAADDDRRREDGVRTWVDEIIWRDFYAQILEQHPRVLRHSFRSEYDALPWNDDPEGLEAWKQGRTGYPIVDAGMRQLLREGWMHNRLRMIVASFLTKDLLLDWRLGERWFFRRLVDGDPASNNGGWQWAASTGTDAQPYFRIFNPVTQGRRFDPDGAYVRRFVPELAGLPDACVHEPWKAERPPDDYPPPRVDHRERRAEALRRYERARRTAGS